MGAVAAVAVAVSAPALGDAQQCQRMYELHSLCGLRLALPVRKTHFSCRRVDLQQRPAAQVQHLQLHVLQHYRKHILY